MASVWIRTRTTSKGDVRYRVAYRPGGRDAKTRFAGGSIHQGVHRRRRAGVLTA